MNQNRSRIFPTVLVLFSVFTYLGITVQKSLSAPSSDLAPPFTLKIETQGSGAGAAIHLLPPSGHHLNEKAPIVAHQDSRSLSVHEATAAGAWILGAKNAASPKTARDRVSVSAFVCDDAGSYCVKKTAELGPELLVGLPVSMPGVIAALPGAGPRHGTELGFVLNDPEKAFALAKKQNKPLLIDFYGIWCPPCNVMDETVFRTAHFQKFAKSRFVLLKLDADSELAWKWRESYQIQGYPTILMTDLNGEEVGRVVGSRRPLAFQKWMEESYALRGQPVKQDSKRAEDGDGSAQWRMGNWAKERGEWMEAVKWLTLAQATEKWPKNDRRWIPLFEAKVAQEKDPTKLVAILTEAVAQTPESVERAEWASSLATQYEELKKPTERKKALELALSTLESLLKTPGGFNASGEQETEIEDLLEMKAEMLSGLEKADEAKSVFLEAASIYQRKIGALDSSNRDRERGWNLSRAYCLREGGKFNDAKLLYQQLVKKYPSEFTFHFAFARLLVSTKDWKAALPEAEAAFRPSYGDNRLRAANLLANVQKELGKRAEALELIRQTLRDFPTPSTGTNKPNRTYEALKKSEAELASSGAPH